MEALRQGSLVAGRYEIVRVLGSGANGQVFLALDRSLESFPVALKIIHPALIGDDVSVSRFRHEVLAMRRVNHPNVVRAYEYIDEGEIQGYSMDFLDGGDLQRLIDGTKLSGPQITSVLTQLAGGLQAIHFEGVYHRDLKPANILLSDVGQVKISDFGVARVVSSRALTSPGLAVGTPVYLPPEYLETGDCDQRSDIYSFGIIGYQLIAKRLPYEARTYGHFISLQRAGRYPRLEEIAPECDPRLANIVERAFSVNPDARFQTAQELVEAMSALERPDTIKTPRPATSHEHSKLKPTHASLLWLVFIASAALSFGFFWNRSPVLLQPSSFPDALIDLRPETLKLTDQTAVSSWDAKGGKLSITQGSISHMPYFRRNGMSGSGTLYFDGAAYLDGAALVPGLRELKECTFIFAARTDTRATQYVFALHRDDRHFEVLRMGFDANGRLRLQKDSHMPSAFELTSPPLASIERFAVYTIILGSDYAALFQNGILLERAFLPSPVKFSEVRYFSIGQEWDKEKPSDYFQGELGEFMLFPWALKDGERERLEKPLLEKYRPAN